MGVKEPKTTYNNNKPASKIKQYIIKHIYNLDKVLVDLKQAKILIFRAKSQL